MVWPAAVSSLVGIPWRVPWRVCPVFVLLYSLCPVLLCSGLDGARLAVGPPGPSKRYEGDCSAVPKLVLCGYYVWWSSASCIYMAVCRRLQFLSSPLPDTINRTTNQRTPRPPTPQPNSLYPTMHASLLLLPFLPFLVSAYPGLTHARSPIAQFNPNPDPM